MSTIDDIRGLKIKKLINAVMALTLYLWNSQYNNDYCVLSPDDCSLQPKRVIDWLTVNLSIQTGFYILFQYFVD